VNSTILSALAAAALFGASTPFAKLLVGEMTPVMLAGLLYLGSGIGVTVFRLIRNRGWTPSGLTQTDWPLLWIAIVYVILYCCCVSVTLSNSNGYIDAQHF